jgi:hypothetical protein
LIEARFVGLGDGVVVGLFAATEAIEDDENEERAAHAPQDIK